MWRPPVPGLRLAAAAALVTVAAAVAAVVLAGQKADWSASDVARCGSLCRPVVCTQCTRVSFTTVDGIALSGIRRGSGRSALVLSNEYVSGQSIWRALPEQLQRMGYVVLTYDYRGIGESSGRFDPTRGAEDLQAAIGYIRATGADRVVLIGSSLGGLLSADLAANAGADGLVLISPARSFAGLTVRDAALRELGIPKLFAWFSDDKVTAQASHMFEVAGAPKDKVIYPGSGHGTQLLRTGSGGDFVRTLQAWLLVHLPAR
jgi:pimeloyl-ACP methyl ester carboxylesterase